MDKQRRTNTVRQLELLVEFAEENKPLALGKLRSKEARHISHRLWDACARKLNLEGPARLPKEWAKCWNDFKSRVRMKLAAQKNLSSTSSSEPLTPLEDRVADLIGRDFRVIPNGSQNFFVSAEFESSATSEPTEKVEIQDIHVLQVTQEDAEQELSPPASPIRPWLDRSQESMIRLLLPTLSNANRDPLRARIEESKERESAARSPVSVSSSPASTPRSRSPAERSPDSRSRRHEHEGRFPANSHARSSHTRRASQPSQKTNRSTFDESRRIDLEELRAANEAKQAEAALIMARNYEKFAAASLLIASGLKTLCDSIARNLSADWVSPDNNRKRRKY